jgi:WD40 repeat protein
MCGAELNGADLTDAVFGELASLPAFTGSSSSSNNDSSDNSSCAAADSGCATAAASCDDMLIIASQSGAVRVYLCDGAWTLQCEYAAAAPAQQQQQAQQQLQQSGHSPRRSSSAAALSVPAVSCLAAVVCRNSSSSSSSGAVLQLAIAGSAFDATAGAEAGGPAAGVGSIAIATAPLPNSSSSGSAVFTVQLLLTGGHTQRVTALAYCSSSSSGSSSSNSERRCLLASGSQDRGVALWASTASGDTVLARRLPHQSAPVTCLAWAPASTISSSNSNSSSSSGRGSSSSRSSASSTAGNSSDSEHVQQQEQLRYLAVACADGTVSVYLAAARAAAFICTLDAHSSSVSGLSWRPAAGASSATTAAVEGLRMLGSCSLDGTVAVWQQQKQQKQQWRSAVALPADAGIGSRVLHLLFLADGRFATGKHDYGRTSAYY